ncbi:RING zinc finger protein, putative [Plasmodium gallinaceum]|uniref:RING-type E3 ubiquitin transferase n=1 Tax=Plasmodium gallinaceum TaxID=5849 RepID=A0A1J1GMQ5_PLAGA|nr:RING zinc finger protein, putative [Plasmodium gallinaceum]CRG93652.1 RING zinc finger protein, putative [Plasmodium gallinaceum]
MNIDSEDINNNDGNFTHINNTEMIIFRYFTIFLYFLLFCNIFSLFGLGIYFLSIPCEKCDFYNRILVTVILVKSIAHLKLTIIKVKRRDEIENNERLKNIIVFLIKIFNFLTFLLAVVSLYFLHFYNNICVTPTLSLKLIRIYYYFTITLYFIPLLFYISIGLFLSIIICIMINYSVEEGDRIPTPENIISRLKIVKYKDLDYIHKKGKKSNKNKKYIKKPSFEMIFDKVKSVIIDKENNEKKKKMQLNSSNSNIIDENLQEMLKPLNTNIESEINYNNDNNKVTQENLLNNNKEISNENEDVCSICMMNYINNDDVMIMPCDKRHFFHVSCLTKWLYKSQVCPICRTNIVNCFNSKNNIV